MTDSFRGDVVAGVLEMFISYQSVRNSVVAGVLGLAGLGIYWTSSGDGGRAPSSDTYAVAPATPGSPPAASPLLSPVGMDSPPSGVAPTPAGDPEASPPSPPTPSPSAVAEVTELTGSSTDQAGTISPTAAADTLIARAMQIALAPARPQGGKDVLGSSSPWKLNLYDDNQDGRWDRGKLDTNRDEIDDEKWNFKDGRWEKDGGALVWSDGGWRPAAAAAGVQTGTTTSASPQGNPSAVAAATEAPKSAGSPEVSTAAADEPLERYRAAMKIATSPAVQGKGKDILGSRHPWKLNLYDDNHDGQWDRGKLDTNRDEVDDEKWNFKKGRWEKDGGAKIWNGSDWVNE